MELEVIIDVQNQRLKHIVETSKCYQFQFEVLKRLQQIEHKEVSS